MVETDGNKKVGKGDEEIIKEVDTIKEEITEIFQEGNSQVY